MPFLKLTELIEDLAEAGEQVTALGAAEGSSGNLSIFVTQLAESALSFTNQGTLPLPVPVPALEGGWLLITASGKRLRDIARHSQQSLCLLRIGAGGLTAELFAQAGIKPTSELNSHLGIHHTTVSEGKLTFHAVVHAQPLYLTYLSHIPMYQEEKELNRRLLRWEAETSIVFPEGLGTIPYHLIGSEEQMRDTAAGMSRHQLVIWQQHGVVARSSVSAVKAADLIEYAETAAHYEYLNLTAGQPADGLSQAQLAEIHKKFYPAG